MPSSVHRFAEGDPVSAPLHPRGPYAPAIVVAVELDQPHTSCPSTPEKEIISTNAQTLLTVDDALVFKEPTHYPNSNSLDSLETERVYLHYVGKDRRLDRWVNVKYVKERVADQNHSQSDDVTDDQGGYKFLTRSRRRKIEAVNPVSEREKGNDIVEKMEKAREEITKVRNIDRVVFGNYDLEAWYYAPFPAFTSREVFMCDHCLSWFGNEMQYVAHKTIHCDWEHPPGLLIYEDHERMLSMYEVDGMVNSEYCGKLCLLAKLFLDHKTLYHDVAPFNFYVLLLNDELAGFFSKEKPMLGSDYNLSCILTMPQHQRKGIGRFLIAFSYELTKREGKTAGPERPLSDLGQVSYRSYWAHSIVTYLRSRQTSNVVPAEVIAEATGIQSNDVISVLKSLEVFHYYKQVSYADPRSKAMEDVDSKLSEPRLPLDASLIRDDIPCLSNEEVSVAKTTRSAGRPKRKRTAKAAMEKPVKRGKSSSSQQELTECSGQQLKRLSAFMRTHSARVVQNMLTPRNGQIASEISALAGEIGISTQECASKLKRLADSSMSTQLNKVFSRKTPGEVLTSVNKWESMRSPVRGRSRSNGVHRNGSAGSRNVQYLDDDPFVHIPATSRHNGSPIRLSKSNGMSDKRTNTVQVGSSSRSTQNRLIASHADGAIRNGRSNANSSLDADETRKPIQSRYGGLFGYLDTGNPKEVIGTNSPERTRIPKKLAFDSPRDTGLLGTPDSTIRSPITKEAKLVRHQLNPDFSPVNEQTIRTDVPRAMQAHGIDDNRFLMRGGASGHKNGQNGKLSTPRPRKLELSEPKPGQVRHPDEVPSEKRRRPVGEQDDEVILIN